MIDAAKEQDNFQKKIEIEYISFFELLSEMAKEKNATLAELGRYLLPKFNDYLKTRPAVQIAYKLLTPPFKSYILPSVSNNKILWHLNYIQKNNSFSSLNTVKNLMLSRAEVSKALTAKNTITQTSATNNYSYNERERESHLQIITALTLKLAESAGKYRKNDNTPNITAIASELSYIIDGLYIEALKPRSAETIRKRVAEAMQKLI